MLRQLSGDTWSIGGKQPQTVTSPIVGAGDGLSGSHNKFESDASAARGGMLYIIISRDFYYLLLIINADYYLYDGDVSVGTSLD